MSGFATLLGWQFPRVPVDTPIVELVGSVAVPVAGGAAVPYDAYVTGNAPFGAGGVLLSSSQQFYNPGGRLVARVLAAGFGIRRAAQPFQGSASIPGGGGTQAIFGPAGMVNVGGAPFTDPMRYKCLIVTSGTNTMQWVHVAGQQAVNYWQSFPRDLGDGVGDGSELTLVNPSGGAQTSYVYGVRHDPAEMANVSCGFVLQDIDQSGLVLETSKFAEVWTPRAQLLDNDDGLPDVLPMNGHRDSFTLRPGRALSAGVKLAAGAVLPSSAEFVARVIVALYQAGE